MPKSRGLVLLAVAIVFLVAVAYIAIKVLSPAPLSPLNQRLQELENDGYNTKSYPYTFAEVKADRSEATFHQADWDTFKQQVVATKADLGFVTVWWHSGEGIMWVGRYDWAYYYFVVD